MRPTDPSKVLAILCADIHLSHKPPIGRSAEPSWYASMERQLEQLCDLQVRYDCPVICAGDVFDKWNAPAELINFAIRALPRRLYAVPGQHDLPNHRWEDIHRSAYWTLQESGKIQTIAPMGTKVGRELTAYGFGWDLDLKPILRAGKNGIHLAVVHAYCYHGPATKHPGADPKTKSTSRFRKSRGYDAVVFGDNHIGWEDKDSNVLNCGTFMRRKYDDPLKTYVGALLDTGEIYRIELDNSEDKWLHQVDGIRNLVRDWGVQEFIEDLAQLSSSEFDFAHRVQQFVRDNKVNESTRKILLEALEDTE